MTAPEPGPAPPGPATPGPATGDLPTTVLSEGEGGRPRHARPPRTAGDYARALGARARAQLPLTAVLVVAAVAFWRIGLQHWREGTTILGIALLLGAVLRATLSDEVAGLLAVRPRGSDVALYGALGVVVILVSLTITGGPLATR